MSMIRSEPLASEPRSSGPLFFGVTLLFFFVSGACGLLYQVVWTRKLVLLFGVTAYAVSTVLSVFFLGLAVGSLWGGRLADRTRNPLRLYGFFEALIGVWAILFILFIGLGEAGVVWVLRLVSGSHGMSVVLRALLAAAFLIVPVVLMGATLPLVARFVASDSRTRGLRIGSLYSVNTLGAVVGCAATGFVLLPTLGYTRTVLAGAAANGFVGLLAILLSKKYIRTSPNDATSFPAQIAPANMNRQGIASFAVVLVLGAFALSGFCALALEVLWTRLLVTVFIGTTYAFTAMLTTLLCGIAAGSAVAASLVDRRRHLVSLFGIIELLFGVSCLLMLPVFAWLPGRFAAWRLSVGFDWNRLVWAKFWLSFAVLFVPTFLSGMTFPVVVRALTLARSRLGRDIGRLYSANTFGGVLGAAAGGYLLIPLLGTHWGIVVLGLTLCVVGAGLILACPTRPLLAKTVFLVAGVALLVTTVRALPQDISRVLDRSYVPETEHIIHHREGVEGTVAVSEPNAETHGSNRTLWINGVQATISIEAGVLMNRFQGVLPMCFDRDPRQALFMCFGSGITAGTLGLFDFERIDAVELSRDVLEAAPLFAADNFNVLGNPKINFIVDDGRNFLLKTVNRYDVITFEPMPLALAGVSTFYTREYYTLCLNHLNPGGLVSQWIPLHSLSSEVVRSLIYTFTDVFPEYCAWFVNADLFMVGSNRALAIDYHGVERRLGVPTVHQALRDAGFTDLPELLTCFFMSKAAVDRYCAGGSIMNDDRPWAEFVAPKLMYEHNVAKALRELLDYYESPLALMRRPAADDAVGQTVRQTIARRYDARKHALAGMVELRRAGLLGSSEDEFEKALAIDPNCDYARTHLLGIAGVRVDQWTKSEEFEEAQNYLTRLLLSLPDEPRLRLYLGDVYFAKGDMPQALVNYRSYVEGGGDEPRASARIAALSTTQRS